VGEEEELAGNNHQGEMEDLEDLEDLEDVEDLEVQDRHDFVFFLFFLDFFFLFFLSRGDFFFLFFLFLFFLFHYKQVQRVVLEDNIQEELMKEDKTLLKYHEGLPRLYRLRLGLQEKEANMVHMDARHGQAVKYVLQVFEELEEGVVQL
jgi:hypothetical protein